MNKTVMILAGGTGGHIYPAMALAQGLHQKDVRIVWVGTRQGLESKINFPDYIQQEWIEISGIRGKKMSQLLKFPIVMMRAMMQIFKIIKNHQPDAVLSTGGYVSGPGGVAAFIKKIPLIIHESNAIAGMTNQWLSKVATKVLVALPNTQKIGSKGIVVGNPVRSNIVSKNTQQQEASVKNNGFNIAIVGGSQGAQIFNEVLPDAFKKLKANCPDVDISIIHQTGKGKKDKVVEKYNQLEVKAQVNEYIEDMAQLYQQADVVICRAGAMTLAEVCLSGVVAIIIPLPTSAGDHQLLNAKYMAQAGSAVLIEQKNLSADSLSHEIEVLINDRDKLKVMAAKSNTLANPDAAEKSLQIVMEVLHA